MEKKKTTVQQRKAIEIALVLFCVGTILFSWMTDMSLIKIPEELLMEISSIEDFLFTIFSVQASIATVSIAVISIITGFANECYLGVSISEFITTIKPCILTHKRLIVISLLLVICSYIAVAFKWINLCISLFFISIIAELLTEFMSFFCTGTIREDFSTAKLEILHDIFNEKYMQEAIRESQNQRVDDVSIREYAEKLQMSVAGYAAKNFAMFRFYTCEIMEELPITAEPEINVISMRIPHAIIKDNTLLSDLQNNMAEQMMVVFLRRIIGNLAFEEVKYDRKDKQKTLIDMVEGLPIVPDVVIGERDTFWSESDQKMLQKYTNGMRHLEYPGGYNYYFIIDSSKIGFSIENIRISYANEEVESILARCEMREDGKYLLNITNDIFIPFSKDDLIKYVHDTEKVLTLSADIKYRIRADKVGAGMEIVT